MRTLSIRTKIYSEVLSRFFSTESELVLAGGCENGVHYICVCDRQSTRNKLQSLMEYIILSENPALSDNEKAFVNVAELAFGSDREMIGSRLTEFLKETGSINIEGYINFRMGEYPERINEILYSIVKNKFSKTHKTLIE